MATADRTAPVAALSSTEALADALLGMAWWNGLSEGERARWLDAADSAVPADAWAAYKAESYCPDCGGRGRPDSFPCAFCSAPAR